jgi:hypothetical protein
VKLSYWLDQRDVPDGRWGKRRIPDCRCTSSFTCGACLAYASTRNMAETRGGGVSVARRGPITQGGTHV